MQNETRVNLKHLLEDIRDSYSSPLEEVILSELIANALDSKAANIHFEINKNSNVLRCVDDGQGMKRASLREYHNIASTSKQRGLGIGFAGVGAKLSLLLAEKVITESKGGYGSRCATKWRLTSPYRAPWKFLPFSGAVPGPRGTSVSIYLGDSQSHLISPDFVRQAIVRHFYPLLNSRMHQELLRFFYKKPVSFFINNERITLPESGHQALQHWFKAAVGKSRRPAGIGFLARTEIQGNWLDNFLGKKIIATSLPAGLCISTFGKIIKGGWEWLGIIPKHADNLSGVVEIPALSEILTTNKNDFLTDSASLKKYYKFRKSVQEAVMPILERLGENQNKSRLAPGRLIRPLNQVVSGTLNSLMTDFPELEGLIGAGRARTAGRKAKDEQGFKIKSKQNLLAEDYEQKNKDHGDHGKDNKIPPLGIADSAKKKQVRAKTSGLKIELADIEDSENVILGRIIDNALTVNTLHPAWLKAKQTGLEEYHVMVVVASVLSEFLEDEKSPHEFLNRFLRSWAKTDAIPKSGTLF